MDSIITHGATILATIVGLIATIVGVWFHGKATGKAKAETENQIAAAEEKVVETKAVAAHEVKVVKVVTDAKQQTSDLSDADLRKRMRENYTRGTKDN